MIDIPSLARPTHDQLDVTSIALIFVAGDTLSGHERIIHHELLVMSYQCKTLSMMRLSSGRLHCIWWHGLDFPVLHSCPLAEVHLTNGFTSLPWSRSGPLSGRTSSQVS